MANTVGQRIGDLDPASSALLTDAVIIERNPGANGVTYQIAVQDLGKSMPINNLAEKSTPANSTITSTQGHFWFDASYLYITTANNVTKRVALSSF